MSNLARRSANSVTHPGDNPAAATPTENSTVTMTYLKSFTAWEDLEELLPPESREGKTIAASVDTPKGAVRTKQGTFHQRRIAWRATPYAVFIFTLHRQLSRTADGKFRPEGGWVIANTEVLSFINAPTLRSGVVPFAQQDTSGGAENKVKESSGEAVYEVLSLLPSTVQAGVLAYIKEPTYENGTNWQYSDSSELAQRQTLEYLRVNETHVTVVAAERGLSPDEEDFLRDPRVRDEALSKKSWSVSQTSGAIKRETNSLRLRS